jgi:hypothetical protein
LNINKKHQIGAFFGSNMKLISILYVYLILFVYLCCATGVTSKKLVQRY